MPATNAVHERSFSALRRLKHGCVQQCNNTDSTGACCYMFTKTELTTCLCIVLQMNLHCGMIVECIYHMSTNFRGWLNFAVFEDTSQTAKNSPGEIFFWGYAHARTRTVTGQDKLENDAPSLLSFNHWPWRETLCVASFVITCSLIHKYHRTTNLEKGVVITPITYPRKLKPSKI